MISKRKSYQFNNRSLQFEAEVVPIKKRIRKSLHFFLITGLIAALTFVILQLAYWSPIDIFLHSKVTFYKNNFLMLNSHLDSLQNILHKNYISSDNYYRAVLGIDSLPTPIRYAGIGGALPILHFDAFPYSELINSTIQKNDALKSQFKIQEDSYNHIFSEAVLYKKELTGIPAIQPVKPSEKISISSSFGTRSDPFTLLWKTHTGLDFVGPLKTEIFATANGVVTLAEDSRTGYGKEIVILHEFGYSTRYAHLNKIFVITGQKITRGQLIGQMGNTGRSTGTHLHYEVRLNNRPQNPFYYFADDLSVKDYEQITNLNLK